MHASARDRLVDAALELFQRDGFHATGIDRILARAGVAKMTLYNNFRGKDDLILAAIRRADEQFRNWFIREVERRESTARGRLLAMFDVLGDWHQSDSFQGCLFAGAASEYAEAENPIHSACAEHKRLMRQWVTGLATEAGAGEAQELSSQLCLLMDGATAQAEVCGECRASSVAKAAAVTLLNAATTR